MSIQQVAAFYDEQRHSEDLKPATDAYDKGYLQGISAVLEHLKRQHTQFDLDAQARFVTDRLSDNGYEVPKTEVWLALSNYEALMSPLVPVKSIAIDGYAEVNDEQAELLNDPDDLGGLHR